MAMAALPMILMLAGTAVAVYGTYQQAQAQKKSADYSARVAEQNALLARQQAQLRAGQQDRLNRLRLGSIRAAAGAAGGVASEGSVIDIIADQAVQNELQKQEMIYEGELKARGFESQAELSRMGGEAAIQAGKVGAGSALLGGATQSYGMLKRG